MCKLIQSRRILTDNRVQIHLHDTNLIQMQMIHLETETMQHGIEQLHIKLWREQEKSHTWIEVLIWMFRTMWIEFHHEQWCSSWSQNNELVHCSQNNEIDKTLHWLQCDFTQINDDEKQVEQTSMYIEKHTMLDEVQFLQIWLCQRQAETVWFLYETLHNCKSMWIDFWKIREAETMLFRTGIHSHQSESDDDMQIEVRNEISSDMFETISLKKEIGRNQTSRRLWIRWKTNIEYHRKKHHFGAFSYSQKYFFVLL